MSASSIIVVAAALVIIPKITVPGSNEVFERVIIARLGIGIANNSAKWRTSCLIIEISADNFHFVRLSSRRGIFSAIGRSSYHFALNLYHIQGNTRRQIVNYDAYCRTMRLSEYRYFDITAPYSAHLFLHFSSRLNLSCSRSPNLASICLIKF